MHKQIIFFNHFNRGDIHVSREFIKKLIIKLKTIYEDVSFEYSHRNDTSILADIDISHNTNAIHSIDQNIPYKLIGDTIYFNTWYGQRNNLYINRYGITIDALYDAFNDNCKELWGFDLSDLSTDYKSFYPTIDYSKYSIDRANEWIQTHPQRKIFVSNGPVLSNQSYNFDMTRAIAGLITHHKGIMWILSNKQSPLYHMSNVAYSSDIIGKHGCDLNENSFLAAHCDRIIGRASGAFTFAMTQGNLFEGERYFLCFSNLIPSMPNKFWMGHKFQSNVNYSAKVIVANESNIHSVANMISQYM